jgi:hypothetical protein
MRTSILSREKQFGLTLVPFGSIFLVVLFLASAWPVFSRPHRQYALVQAAKAPHCSSNSALVSAAVLGRGYLRANDGLP